nr:hypothetical protein [Bacteroidales bacterium]
MRTFLRILLLLICICDLITIGAYAQNYTMPSNDTIALTTCSGVLLDPGGTSTYPNSCESQITIYPSETGCKVNISGSYETESSFDYFYVYDGTTTSGTQLGYFSGAGTCNVTSNSGPLTIRFHSDGSVQKNGFELNINCGGGCTCGGPIGVETTSSDQTITVSWDAAAGVTSYFLEYGPHGFTPGMSTPIYTQQLSYDIQNLTNETEYDIYVWFDCGNDHQITTEIPTMVSATPHNYVLMESGTSTITSCGVTIYDNGGPDGNYSTSSNDTLIIYPSINGCAVSLIGSYYTESITYDYVKIYNGVGVSGTLLATLGGNSSMTSPIMSTDASGALTIVFHSDGSVQYTGFEFFTDCSGGCSCGIGPADLSANVTDHQVVLSWAAANGASGYRIEYGPHGFTPGTGTIVNTYNTSYTFSNLTNGVELDFYVSMICNSSPMPPESISATPDNIYVMSSGSHSLTKCNVTLYDNGGPEGNYTSNSNDTLILYPEHSGCRVSVSGTYNMQYVSYDYLQIFNGVGVSGTELAKLGGNGTITTPLYSTDQTGALTFVFHSNATTEYSGFELNTLCICDLTHFYDTICFGDHYQAHGFDTIFTVPGDHYLSRLTAGDTLIEVDIHMYAKPPVSINGGYYFCSDSSITLTANSAVSYLWSTGETTQSITVNQVGSYRVTITDNHGCTNHTTHVIAPIEDFISAINFPEMCAGNEYLITGSYNHESEIEMHHTHSTLAVSDTAFLPDGIACDPWGCSYRSTLTFTDFLPNATVESVDDIYYVKINMEHSYIGDIYINITCPNGQKADIMKWSGTGSTECSSSIPASSRTWQSGTNMTYAHFGEAYDYEASDKCDRTAANNAPGTGWNYCWSNNINQNYIYAADGALVYRSANIHNGIVDSSNVAAGTQFYHPDQSFESLIGCPLNGAWYIEVMDGWGIDNGYVFEWELALTDEILTSNTFNVSSITTDTIWTTTVSDTSFTISPPATLSGDTTILYTLHFYDSEGCAFDTVVPINVYTTHYGDVWKTACDSYTWHGQTYTSTPTTNPTFTSQTAIGCDSVTTLHLTIKYGTHDAESVTTCENYTWHGQTYQSSGTYTYAYNNADGCPSVDTLHVTIVTSTSVEETIMECESYTWHGTTYTESGDYTWETTGTNGCDSTATLHLTINNPTTGAETVAECENFTWHGTTYTESGDYTWETTGANGCDSTATLHLTINNPTTGAETVVECESFTWHGTTYYESGDYTWETTGTNGCDSTATLHLTINNPTSGAETVEECESFTWHGTTYTESGNYTWNTTGANGCDSTATLHLTINHKTYGDVYATACGSFTWHGQTYTQTPSEDPTFTITGGNHNGCDSIVTLHLTINHGTHNVETETACESYGWHGQTYETSGTYTYEYNNE